MGRGLYILSHKQGELSTKYPKGWLACSHGGFKRVIIYKDLHRNLAPITYHSLGEQGESFVTFIVLFLCAINDYELWGGGFQIANTSLSGNIIHHRALSVHSTA